MYYINALIAGKQKNGKSCTESNGYEWYPINPMGLWLSFNFNFKILMKKNGLIGTFWCTKKWWYYNNVYTNGMIIAYL